MFVSQIHPYCILEDSKICIPCAKFNLNKLLVCSFYLLELRHFYSLAKTVRVKKRARQEGQITLKV